MACVYDCICYVCVCVCLRINVLVYVYVHYVFMMFVLLCTCKIICKLVVAAPIENNGEQKRHDKAATAKREHRRQNETDGDKTR